MTLTGGECPVVDEHLTIIMKPLVNFATDPFRNRRLFWVTVFLMFSITTILGQQVIRQRAEREGEIRSLESVVRQLEGRLGKPSPTPASGSGSALIQPDQNTELYAASEMIARKSFSWSSLLDEIERVLPPGVRVLRIAVTTVLPEEKDGSIGGPESAATLNLEVIAKSNQDVVKLINLLHGLGRFRVSPLSQKPVEGTGEIEFSLKVEYFPRPLTPPDTQTARALPLPKDRIKTPTTPSSSGSDSLVQGRTR
jgi:hypothetical protein